MLWLLIEEDIFAQILSLIVIVKKIHIFCLFIDYLFSVVFMVVPAAFSMIRKLFAFPEN